jgi:DNA-binding SARP family transcriptional activator
VEVGLLGPLHLVDHTGAVIVVHGAKVRALLCRLALDVGQVVANDRLLEDLWGGTQPERPNNALQGLVSRLRRALGAPDVILNRGSGYVLDLADDALDMAAFHRLGALGRSALARGDHEEALAVFDRALSLWRGPPLADVAYEDFAQSAITRLLEAKATLLEDRVDALLHLGRHAEAVSELESLIDEYPLRERLRAHLMLALYRAGRQAEALRAFQQGRIVLGEELGIERGCNSAAWRRRFWLRTPPLPLLKSRPRKQRCPCPAAPTSPPPSPRWWGARTRSRSCRAWSDPRGW